MINTFMAYDFAVKKAFHVASLQYTNFGIYCEVKCASGSISVGFNHYGRSEDYRLLRSTGKKDSYGKPIYEGHIIRCSAGEFEAMELLIEWKNETSSFIGRDLETVQHYTLKGLEHWAIVGEQFDGPKSLKKV